MHIKFDQLPLILINPLLIWKVTGQSTTHTRSILSIISWESNYLSVFSSKCLPDINPKILKEHASTWTLVGRNSVRNTLLMWRKAISNHTQTRLRQRNTKRYRQEYQQPKMKKRGRCKNIILWAHFRLPGQGKGPWGLAWELSAFTRGVRWQSWQPHIVQVPQITAISNSSSLLEP